MRKLACVLPLLPLFLLAAADGPRKLAAETSLRGSPDDPALQGLLTTGSAVTVLEQRGEWVRVRVEGWIPASALGEPEPRSEAAVVAPVPPPAPATASGQVVLEGTISVKPKDKRRVKGAGIEVYLLPEGVAQQWESEGRDSALQVAKLDDELLRLDAEIARAMGETNFTEAIRKRDKLAAERDRVLADRVNIVAAWHARHEAVARQQAHSSTTSDAAGRYVFSTLAPGSYTLYARLNRDKVDAEWIQTVAVAEEGVKLDLDETRVRGMR
ncbi:MAG TPA: hypothetical protein VJS92_17080 [Candidatus Polarisedimenticolaceae bacterium]|nr:hypothetical protein [Candidatus Polarisedimenticolaceae bacterium]